ncbi:MAG: hypothetical protein Q8Q01_05450 [archaeon]|nr:hypothetical protein [archaeon]
MKKIIIPCVFLLLVFIVSSCSTQFVCSDGSVTDSPDNCQGADVQDNSDVVQADEVVGFPGGLMELIQKGQNVQSFTYDYKEISKPKEPTYPYKIYGSTVKRYLPVKTGILNQNELDVIISDRLSKTSLGYCESLKYCIKQGEIGSVDFSEYYVDTPFDWLDRIQRAEIETKNEELFGRGVWKVIANNGEFTIWIENYYGVPLKVSTVSETYEFRNPKFNTIKSNDVEFEEISS